MANAKVTKPLRQFEIHERHLPHWEEPGATYFVTWVLRRPPPVDITEPRLGALVIQALRFWDRRRYLLFDYTVMPDHVYAILKPLVRDEQSARLSAIHHSLKSWLANRINRAVGRRGPLWQDESHDHILRNLQDYEEKAAYIFDNPRAKGLIADPTLWPWWGQGSGWRGDLT